MSEEPIELRKPSSSLLSLAQKKSIFLKLLLLSASKLNINPPSFNLL